MFKAVTIFKHNLDSLSGSLPDFESAEHTPIGPTSTKAVGFIRPRGIGYGFYESIDAANILAVMVETKSVPASAVNDALKKAVEAIEASTGRKPGKKEKRDLKEEIVFSLLPSAFPKQTRIDVMLKGDLCYIGSTSSSKIDDVATLLVRSIEGLVIEPLNTVTGPGSYMTGMLAGHDDGSNFYVGRSLHLKAVDESKADVKYTNHNLDGVREEVATHIAQGKRPIALALEDGDLGIGFTLTDSTQLKKIDIDDDVLLGSKQDREDAFEASWFIASSVLHSTVQRLIEELGGEAKEAGNV